MTPPGIILHASCVALAGRGLLIRGAPGSGKSTLALTLMGLGADLVGDDRIDLRLEDRHTDLYAEGIDLAIRIGRLRDSSLVATRLCDIDLGYFASAAYLERHGEPVRPEDLSRHRCLIYSLIQDFADWQPADQRISMKTKIHPYMKSTTGEFLREAAVAGHGIVVYLPPPTAPLAGQLGKLRSQEALGSSPLAAEPAGGDRGNLREYGLGAQVLRDLGLQRIRLLTNNPRPIPGLQGYGITVVDTAPLD